jgi:hypothetical protein
MLIHPPHKANSAFTPIISRACLSPSGWWISRKRRNMKSYNDPISTLSLVAELTTSRKRQKVADGIVMDPHRLSGFLRGMSRRPWLLRCHDISVLDETAVIISIKGLQGLWDRGVRQEDGLTPWPIVPPCY